MGEGIKEGDRVDVRLLSDYGVKGTITHTPCAAGDSWHLKTDEGMIVYFQQYICMFEI